LIESLKLILTPIMGTVSFLIVGLLLTRGIRIKFRERFGWWILFLATVFIFLLSMRPIANMLVYPLECDYQSFSKKLLSNLDVMVILGGGIYPSGGFRAYPEASGVTYSRVYNGVVLFKQSSARVLVLSGGGLNREKQCEAAVMKNIALTLGVPQEKIITESNSRNTMEQVSELAKLFPQAQKKRMGIVTSAIHMSRSENAFRKKFAKEDIIPLPVNYIYFPPARTIRDFIPSDDAFQISNYAIHEWVGRVYYFSCNRP